MLVRKDTSVHVLHIDLQQSTHNLVSIVHTSRSVRCIVASFSSLLCAGSLNNSDAIVRAPALVHAILLVRAFAPTFSCRPVLHEPGTDVLSGKSDEPRLQTHRQVDACAECPFPVCCEHFRCKLAVLKHPRALSRPHLRSRSCTRSVNFSAVSRQSDCQH